MLLSTLQLAACTNPAPADTSSSTPAAASIVFEGSLPDCRLSLSEEILCARGGSVPVTAVTTAQQNLVPDWYWRRGEPGILLFTGGATVTVQAACADDIEAAIAVYTAEFPSSTEYITGTDETDSRWIDVLLYGEGSLASHYRVPRCSVYEHFATLGRLRYAEGQHIDPLWMLRAAPGSDDRSQDQALIDALDVTWMIESHRATLAQAGTDRTRLYAVGTEINKDMARYRTCRVDGNGYAVMEGWNHDVWQVEYTIDRITGRAALDQERVRVVTCDEPIVEGIW